jgi:hypothetical protein
MQQHCFAKAIGSRHSLPWANLVSTLVCYAVGAVADMGCGPSRQSPRLMISHLCSSMQLLAAAVKQATKQPVSPPQSCGCWGERMQVDQVNTLDFSMSPTPVCQLRYVTTLDD